MKKTLKKFSIIFLVVFLAGFLLRCLLINWTLPYGNNGDLTRYESWARIVHTKSFAATYTTISHDSSYTSPSNDQTPGLLYAVSGAYETWIIAGKIISRLTHTQPGTILWVNTYLQHIFMKIPAMLTDLGMALLAFLIVKRNTGKKKGLLAASLILFNPVIFYNSAVWGQLDSLNNFFFILSLFFAFRKNIILSIISYTVSLYIKLSLLPLLPFYLVFLFFLSGKNIKTIFLGIFFSIAGVIIATFPISSNPIQWLITQLPIIARGELQNITVAAFNFWMVVACFPTVCNNNVPLASQPFLALPLGTWAYLLFTLSCLPLLYLQIKKPKQFISPKSIFLVLSLVALITFLFLPAMHDRYMYPVFPLLAVVVALSKNKIFVIVFTLLSLFQLTNLIYSWYPIVLNSKTTLYHILYGPYLRWIISVCTVIVGGLFYWKAFSEFGKIKNK